MKIRKSLLAFTSALALAACAQPITQSEWTYTVAGLQVGLPILETSLASTPDGAMPAVKKAETQLNTDVAALTGTPESSAARSLPPEA